MIGLGFVAGALLGYWSSGGNVWHALLAGVVGEIVMHVVDWIIG